MPHETKHGDTQRYVGRAVPRREDEALLRGAGRFVDDLRRPDLLHAVMFRSPVAHGRIGRLSLDDARAMPGVEAVFGMADLAPHLTAARMPLSMPSAAIRHVIDPEVLAESEVVYVGQPIAIVVAASRALAEDAAARIECEIEPLPAVVDARAAVVDGAPRGRLDLADNVVARVAMGYGDVEAALARAAHVIRLELEQGKGGGHPMECRGLLAEYDEAADHLTVWNGTQMPHRAREVIVKMLGWSEDRVRVVCPDVGGAFGPKFVTYSEEIVVPLAAYLLRRPVAWIEDRREHFVATTMERSQFWTLTAAVDAEGRLLAIDAEVIHDHGAATPYGVNLPQNAGTNLLGPYRLPAYRFAATLALTNKTPVTPTRGAGRPQGTFAMERLLDRIALDLGLDRAEVRRRNLIGPDEMPFVTPLKTRDGGAMTYDSGDYPAAQAMLLDAVGWAGFRVRQAAARTEGRFIGLGLSNYVEGSGRGPFESALVRIGPSGRVVVATGATAQGQGIVTALAQIAADALDVSIEDIRVIAGDTAAVPLGLGAFASRQAAVGGPAVDRAARAVRDKAIAAAAALLDCSAQEIEVKGGRLYRRQDPSKGLGYGEIASALAAPPGYALPKGSTPGLEATCNFVPEAMTYNNGSHAAEVEVDIETGAVRVLRYVVVHDCGRPINPMVVEGQVVGGLVQALGSALLEEMVYDGEGQPLSTTLGEYLLPSAVGAPRVEVLHMDSPTQINPLGVKGAGESGTLAVAPAIASAIDDALTGLGVFVTKLPVKPQDVVAMIPKGTR